MTGFEGLNKVIQVQLGFSKVWKCVEKEKKEDVFYLMEWMCLTCIVQVKRLETINH